MGRDFVVDRSMVSECAGLGDGHFRPEYSGSPFPSRIHSLLSLSLKDDGSLCYPWALLRMFQGSTAARDAKRKRILDPPPQDSHDDRHLCFPR